MSKEISSNMTVGEIARRSHVCVDRNTTILRASKLMRSYQTSEVVVTDQPQGILVPVGVVSAQDIVTRIIASGLDPVVFTAGDIAWSGPGRATVTDTVSAALQ